MKPHETTLPDMTSDSPERENCVGKAPLGARKVKVKLSPGVQGERSPKGTA